MVMHCRSSTAHRHSPPLLTLPLYILCFQGALRDITLYWPKLRVGGVMAGHDWNDAQHYYYGDPKVRAPKRMPLAVSPRGIVSLYLFTAFTPEAHPIFDTQYPDPTRATPPPCDPPRPRASSTLRPAACRMRTSRSSWRGARTTTAVSRRGGGSSREVRASACLLPTRLPHASLLFADPCFVRLPPLASLPQRGRPVAHARSGGGLLRLPRGRRHGRQAGGARRRRGVRTPPADQRDHLAR